MADAPLSEAPDIVIRALRRYWPLVFVVSVAAGLLGFVRTSSKTVPFEASATLLVAESTTAPFLGATDPKLSLETEVALAMSPPVLRSVASQLGQWPSVAVVIRRDTSLLQFSATAGTAKAAEDTVRIHIDAFRKNAVARDQRAFDDSIAAVNQQIAALGGTTDAQTSSQLKRLIDIRDSLTAARPALVTASRFQTISDGSGTGHRPGAPALRTGVLWALVALFPGVLAAIVLQWLRSAVVRPEELSTRTPVRSLVIRGRKRRAGSLALAGASIIEVELDGKPGVLTMLPISARTKLRGISEEFADSLRSLGRSVSIIEVRETLGDTPEDRRADRLLLALDRQSLARITTTINAAANDCDVLIVCLPSFQSGTAGLALLGVSDVVISVITDKRTPWSTLDAAVRTAHSVAPSGRSLVLVDQNRHSKRTPPPRLDALATAEQN